jgi:hypothetical protein
MGFYLRNYRDQYRWPPADHGALFCVHQMNVEDGPKRKRNRRDTSGEERERDSRWLKEKRGDIVSFTDEQRPGKNTQRRMKQSTNSSSSPHNSWRIIERKARDPQIAHHHSPFCVCVRWENIKETRKHQSFSLFSFVLLLLWSSS